MMHKTLLVALCLYTSFIFDLELISVPFFITFLYLERNILKCASGVIIHLENRKKEKYSACYLPSLLVIAWR